MKTLNIRQKIIIISVWVLFVIIIIIVGRPTKEVANYNMILLKELARIPIPPNTTLKYQGISRVQSVVSDDYITKLTYDEILHYYDVQLKKNGWNFQKEEKLYNWGVDTGGHKLTYAKGIFRAYLGWNGEHDIDRPKECLYSLAMEKP